MIIKNLKDEDFVNYKSPSMFIGFSTCTFKCEKECGIKVCQNGTLATSPDIEIEPSEIVTRYLKNTITESIVMGGLEPFDSWGDLINLVRLIREKTTDDVVIYTGYYRNEIEEHVNELIKFQNIIVKFGRFIPNQENHYDPTLEICLASNNQYAEKIS